MAGEWTISELQLPLGFYLGDQRVNIPFQHNYFVVRNEHGNIVREINGLALGSDGNPLTIGTFGQPLRVVEGLRFGDRGENETVLARASQEEINTRLRALDICSDLIEDSGVTYQVTGRNSNSIASTIAACLGLVEPNSYIGASTPGSNNLLLTPAQIVSAQLRAGFADGSGISSNRCFVSGTPILLEDNKIDLIENLQIGDLVSAFEYRSGSKKIDLCRISRIFQSTSNSIVDLRGLCCTPGHVFLTGDVDARGHGCFATIASILRDDRTIVEQDGTVLRARTGAALGTCDDDIVEVIYRDHLTGGMLGNEHRVVVRAGIPMPGTALGDGAVSAPRTLAQHFEAHGITILPDGSLCTSDGRHHAACNWPEGSTPFDTHEARNWIVEADGKPYTPPWIRDLVEEDETQCLRVVGAMPTVAGTASTTPAPL